MDFEDDRDFEFKEAPPLEEQKIRKEAQLSEDLPWLRDQVISLRDAQPLLAANS